MSPQDFEALKEVLVDKLKVAPLLVTPEATMEDLGLDSLALAELAILLEKEFGVKVSDDVLLEVETLNDVIQLMEERSGKPV
jgi:acyl carrier protein